MGLDLPVINASLRRFHFFGIRLMAFFRHNSVIGRTPIMAAKAKQNTLYFFLYTYFIILIPNYLQ